MSVQIVLNVPADWARPTLIGPSTSPEDNALIITAGCRILTDSRSEAAGLNQGAEKKRLQAEAVATVLASASAAAEEKNRLEKAWAAEKAALMKQLESFRTSAELATAKIAIHDKDVAKAREAGEASAMREAARLRDDLNAAKAEIAAKEEKRLAAEKDLLAAEKAKAAAVASAVATKDAAFAVERDKVAAAAAAKDAAAAATLHAAIARSAGSSTKGADNEQAFYETLTKSFGTAADYKLLEHKIESGDAIIGWEGGKVMFECKKYGKTVSEKEVMKAHRDMEMHPECDALVFVSDDSDISGHQKPGHFDIGEVHGKPAIWVGHFARAEDKVVFLQMVARVLRELLRIQKRVVALGGGADVVADYKDKMADMLRCFRESKEDLDELVVAQKAYKRAQKNAWESFEEVITTFKDRFERKVVRVFSSDDKPVLKDAKPVLNDAKPVLEDAKPVLNDAKPMSKPLTDDLGKATNAELLEIYKGWLAAGQIKKIKGFQAMSKELRRQALDAA
jgi:hypothetical protein